MRTARTGRVALGSGGRRNRPRVLLVGGLEPAGRAGLLADAEAVRKRGGVPLVVAAAVTAQGRRTFDWRAVVPALIAAQIHALRELGPIHAVKLGMMPGSGQLRAVQRALEGVRVPWVVDPVVRASSGGRLSGLGRRHYLSLARRDVWLTPNAGEAAWLLGLGRIANAHEARRASRLLEALGFEGVVVKGGHVPGPGVTDVLAWKGRARSFRSTRLPRGPEHRGSGCRFASALATELGAGVPPVRAVSAARGVVRASLGARRASRRP
ncbi:MAG TPA: bifunctional hydroxymethylpyrimidine kinase/phosphomethylpyrimidine kinase [Myxococcaceae bacterium]|nr:bifunctional hydroxymethylpyrimidine kinase/phosphomethylpyrimidine kinase [Myxococcaceae bacterium]